jgi:hypothetical protein
MPGPRSPDVNFNGNDSRQRGSMQINDNSGTKIGRLDISMSKDLVVTVHEIRNITTITTRDRNTGKVNTEILVGESPFGT